MTTRRKAAHRRPRSPRKVLWIVGALVVIAAIVLAIVWMTRSTDEQDTSVVTIHGVEYTSNVPVEETGGYVYVYLPVNADVTEVSLSVKNAGDNEQIQSFLEDLDTLVPGEHVLSLSESNLHFIVDGIP